MPRRLSLRPALFALSAAALAALSAPTPAAAQQGQGAQGQGAQGQGAQGQGGGIRTMAMKREGRWALGMRLLPNGAAGCFAGTSNGQQQFFEYVTWNLDISMFRFASPDVLVRTEGEDFWLEMRVDGQPVGRIMARVMQGVATMPVRDQDESKRQFVRALAEGRKLEVFGQDGGKSAEFDLTGARAVLIGFGPCKKRLPAPPAGLGAR